MKKEIASLGRAFRRQAGLTFIEMLVGILIFVTILALLTPILLGVYRDSVATGEAAKIINLTQKISTKMNKSSTFASVDNMFLSRIADDSMVAGPGQVRNGWGGDITLAPATINLANDAFALTSTNVPSQECSTYVNAAEGVMLRIEVAGTRVKDAPAGVPVDPVALEAACDTSATVDVVFIAGKG